MAGCRVHAFCSEVVFDNHPRPIFHFTTFRNLGPFSGDVLFHYQIRAIDFFPSKRVLAMYRQKPISPLGDDLGHALQHVLGVFCRGFLRGISWFDVGAFGGSGKNFRTFYCSLQFIAPDCPCSINCPSLWTWRSLEDHDGLDHCFLLGVFQYL